MACHFPALICHYSANSVTPLVTHFPLVLIKSKKMEKSSGPHHYKFKNSVK